jgi:hypothetical protein
MKDRITVTPPTPMTRPHFRHQPGPGRSVRHAEAFSRGRRTPESLGNCAGIYRLVTDSRHVLTRPLPLSPICANAGGPLRSNLVGIISAWAAISNKRITRFENLRKPITAGRRAIRSFATKAIPPIACKSTRCPVHGESPRECLAAAGGGFTGFCSGLATALPLQSEEAIVH